MSIHIYKITESEARKPSVLILLMILSSFLTGS